MKRKNDLMANLSILTAALVVFVSIAAFILSFEALESLANSNGIERPLSILFPLIVDGAMIAFSLSAFRAALAGERSWWAWTLIVTFTAVSVFLNGFHAFETGMKQSETPLVGIGIAALAPIVVLFTFETFMSQVKTAVRSNIGKLNQVIEELKQEAARREQRNDKLKHDNSKLKQDNDRLKQRSTELGKANREINKLKKQIEEMESIPSIPPKVGQYGRDLLSVVNREMTQAEFCKIHDEGKTAVSRMVAKLNGGGKIEK